MKNVKKAVFWVLIGFCIISVISSLLSLFSFLQMTTFKIKNLEISDTMRSFFKNNTITALILGIVGVVLVAVLGVLLTIDKGDKITKYIIAAILIVAIISISIYFIVHAFYTPSIFKGDNDKFESFDKTFNKNENTYTWWFKYPSFVNYQSYLSAVVSTFLPLLIIAGLMAGSLICKIIPKKPAVEEQAEAESQ